jgi:hypothetical protein
VTAKRPCPVEELTSGPQSGFSLPRVRTKTCPLFSSATLKHSIRHESGSRSQQSLSRLLDELCQFHVLDGSTPNRVADLPRVSDPTENLIRVTTRPAIIEWIDNDLSDDEFPSFDDWNHRTREVIERCSAWHTLFEHTEQRTGADYGPRRRRETRVHALVVAAPNDQGAPAAHDVGGAAIKFRNCYRFELRRVEVRHRESPNPAIVPIVQASSQAFRGRHHLDGSSPPRARS